MRREKAVEERFARLSGRMDAATGSVRELLPWLDQHTSKQLVVARQGARKGGSHAEDPHSNLHDGGNR
jgi:hypothetical protein